MNSISLIAIRLFKWFISYWDIMVVCVFQGAGPFHLVCQMYVCHLWHFLSIILITPGFVFSNLCQLWIFANLKDEKWVSWVEFSYFWYSLGGTSFCFCSYVSFALFLLPCLPFSYWFVSVLYRLWILTLFLSCILYIIFPVFTFPFIFFTVFFFLI